MHLIVTPNLLIQKNYEIIEYNFFFFYSQPKIKSSLFLHPKPRVIHLQTFFFNGKFKLSARCYFTPSHDLHIYRYKGLTNSETGKNTSDIRQERNCSSPEKYKMLNYVSGYALSNIVNTIHFIVFTIVL